MIELDLNQAKFQTTMFMLQKMESLQVLGALRKIRQMTWEQFYDHSGFNWEWIEAKQYYTFRASDKIRVAAVREGNILRLMAVFDDHDSAY